MKKSIRVIAIVLGLFAVGWVIGNVTGNTMKHKTDNRAELADGLFTPRTMIELGYISDPQISPDGSTVLYRVTYTSVEKNSSCSNLYICRTDGSRNRRLTNYANSVSNARWSNDGRSIWFIRNSQIWKAAYKNGRLGKKVKMSDIPSGVSEFKLSPDQNSIIYISTVPGPVKTPKDIMPELDKADAFIADGLMCRHWDHWVTETPRSFIATTVNGTITPDISFDILGCEEKYELPTEPFSGAEQLSWAPDNRHIAYSCRKKTGIEYAFSTNTEIYVYDIPTGEEIQITHGGGYDTDPSWSPDGSRLAWISMARDGYEADKQRLMIADILTDEDGIHIGDVRELASGLDADVSAIVWTADSRKIVFPATVNGIQALFEVEVDGGSDALRLTPEDWWFNFDAPFAIRDGSILTSYQSLCFPTELVKIENGACEQLTRENSELLEKAGKVRQESIHITTPQGETLQCWVLYPPKFDASEKWPGIEMFNGGPQTCLDQSWSKRWNFFLMAQSGYVVILPNRHGDSGFGQAWKEQISGDYQGLNMQDYLLAGKWMKSHKWCGKLAGVGASYGGFSVYNMMGIHGNLYDCFISHAGIFDEKMMWYTTEEAWFGNWDNGGLTEYAYTPGKTGPAGDGITFGGMQQAGAPYADVAKSKYHYANDPESKVTKWHTPILCIHGEKDYRIPYEQGLAAFTAAQMMGVPSKLIVFPEENHWITKPQNSLFWHTEFFNWLELWMK